MCIFKCFHISVMKWIIKIDVRYAVIGSTVNSLKHEIESGLVGRIQYAVHAIYHWMKKRKRFVN